MLQGSEQGELALQWALNLNTENLIVACESEETATELYPESKGITICLDPETENSLVDPCSVWACSQSYDGPGPSESVAEGALALPA